MFHYFPTRRSSDLVIPEGDDFIIYNGVHPDSPTGNDYFKIVGLDNFPENRVRIYNRWGVLVFDEQRYDTNNNVFRGISEGRTTIDRKSVVKGTRGRTRGQ